LRLRKSPGGNEFVDLACLYSHMASREDSRVTSNTIGKLKDLIFI
jgi:hypothetical protein